MDTFKNLPTGIKVFSGLLVLSIALLSVPLLMMPKSPQTASMVPVMITMWFLLGVAYFIPGIVASFKRKPQAAAIWLVNAFLGWTCIGWFAALVWAISNPSQPQVILAGATQAAPVSTAALTAQDASQQIDALMAMKDKGHITEEEFQAKKSAILARI